LSPLFEHNQLHVVGGGNISDRQVYLRPEGRIHSSPRNVVYAIIKRNPVCPNKRSDSITKWR